MLDLVKQETERIESRFLEPACGTGNLLTAILQRKLAVVEKPYGKSQLDFERYAVLAVTSIYGVDILEDNVRQCRHRLYGVFDWDFYSRLFKNRARNKCREAVRFILDRNIVWGDALTLKTVGEKAGYIVFSEWSPFNGSMLKRRDFAFHGLLAHKEVRELPLFSDLGEDVFIPTPEKEYPAVHFTEIFSSGVGFAACRAGSSSSDISCMLARALETGMPRKWVRNTKWVTPSSSM